MYTFLLIVDSSILPDCVGDFIKNIGRMRRESSERYVVEEPGGVRDGWIAIQAVDIGIGCYNKEEMDRLKERVSDPCFILVEGRDGGMEFSTKFVLDLSDPETVLLDNDHGVIEDAKTIKERILSGLEWLNASS